MKIHPAAEIFPMLSDEELDSLAVDIKTHGLRHPLVMHDRELLDGRNRLAACKIAGVAPSFVEYEGDSPVSFVISVNIKRRQLDASQRACVAVEIEPMFAVEAKKRQGQRTDIVANLRQCNQAKPRGSGQLLQVYVCETTALYDCVRSGKMQEKSNPFDGNVFAIVDVADIKKCWTWNKAC